MVAFAFNPLSSFYTDLVAFSLILLLRYSFGITLFELYTSDKAFRGIPRVILGHAITQGARPEFPLNAPKELVALANRCWYPSPSMRPSFKEVLAAIMDLRLAKKGRTHRIQVG